MLMLCRSCLFPYISLAFIFCWFRIWPLLLKMCPLWEHNLIHCPVYIWAFNVITADAPPHTQSYDNNTEFLNDVIDLLTLFHWYNDRDSHYKIKVFIYAFPSFTALFWDNQLGMISLASPLSQVDSIYSHVQSCYMMIMTGMT